jgi:hypothetical protein
MLQYFYDKFNACFGCALLWAVDWIDGMSSEFQTLPGGGHAGGCWPAAWVLFVIAAMRMGNCRRQIILAKI